MAGVGFVGQTGEVSIGTSALTLMQIVAAANQRVRLREFSVSFKGTSNTASPVLVQLMRQTTAGTASALSLKKWNSADDETLQTTAQQTFTVEPTYSDVLITEEVHPQTGYTWQAPFGGEIICKGGEKLAIVVTAGAAVTGEARVIGEE